MKQKYKYKSYIKKRTILLLLMPLCLIFSIRENNIQQFLIVSAIIYFSISNSYYTYYFYDSKIELNYPLRFLWHTKTIPYNKIRKIEYRYDDEYPEFKLIYDNQMFYDLTRIVFSSRTEQLEAVKFLHSKHIPFSGNLMRDRAMVNILQQTPQYSSNSLQKKIQNWSSVSGMEKDDESKTVKSTATEESE